MLSKLLKYELKATSRFFLPLYAALVLLTLISKLTLSFNFNNFAFTDNIIFKTIKVLLIIAYVLVILCTSVMTLVLIVMRFYKNMLTDEGYLTHTLPVKASTHINCKVISALIWTLLSTVMQTFSIIILLIGTGVLPKVREMLNLFFTEVREAGFLSDVIISIIIVSVSMLIAILYSILMLYCSLTIGSLFSKHRILGSIVVYFIINFIAQIINFVTLTLTTKANFEVTFYNIDTNAYIESFEDVVNYSQTIINYFDFTIIVQSTISIIFIVAFYLLSNFIISKKLNLD